MKNEKNWHLCKYHCRKHKRDVKGVTFSYVHPSQLNRNQNYPLEREQF